MKNPIFTKMMNFLDRLEGCGIAYTLTRAREEALMVSVTVPGERWEVEFLCDGSVEVERFRSKGEIEDEATLGELFTRYTETAQTPELAIA